MLKEENSVFGYRKIHYLKKCVQEMKNSLFVRLEIGNFRLQETKRIVLIKVI